jgi:uncharacterized protein YkwD
MQMSMKRRTLLLALAALLPGACRAAAQDTRAEILRRLNVERQRVGAPPLRLLRSLTEVAQDHAEEIARSGQVRLQRGSEKKVDEWMKQAGYNAHRWAESVSASTEDFDQMVREWRSRDRSAWGSIEDSEVLDVGIGLAQMKGVPLYTFLFAVPEVDHFTRITSGLRDAERTRAAMLAQVNALRRKAGATPLKMSKDLQQAAQAHAQDMLARGYFAHKSPSGTSVRERSRAAGYEWRTIGENIAEGQTSVQEVMTTWMNSKGHRENILNPHFRDLGIGLVLGKSRAGEYRVIWVQNFGKR